MTSLECRHHRRIHRAPVRRPRRQNYRTVYALYACIAWSMTSIAYAAAWMAATAGPVLGWSSIKVLLVFGGVTVVCTLLVGLFAVAYNDVLQFILLMVAILHSMRCWCVMQVACTLYGKRLPPCAANNFSLLGHPARKMVNLASLCSCKRTIQAKAVVDFVPSISICRLPE